MSKSRWGILFACCSLMTAQVSAQSSFAGMADESEPPIMSPSDFSSHVKDLGKQTQSDLDTEINADLKKPTPPGAPGGTAPAAQNPTTNPPPPSNPNPDTSPQQVAPLPPPPAGEVPPDQQANPQGTPSAPSAGYQAPQNPNQNQPYTGFGAGSNNNNNNAPPAKSNNNSSGGWNIKY